METTDSIENGRLLCIFCLKFTDRCINDCNSISRNDQNKFFTLIIRHFFNYDALITADNQEWCRSACKAISENTFSSYYDEPFFDNVHICDKCQKIARKFSDLYYQLKDVELRIDWEVDKLCNLLGRADKNVSSQENDELENMSTFDGGGVTLGEFRNTLKQSCKAYQDNKKKVTVPKVQLKQLVTDEDESSLKGLHLERNIKTLKNDSISQPEVQDHPPKLHAQVQQTQPKAHHDYYIQPEVDSHDVTLIKEVEVVQHNDEQTKNAKFQEYPVALNCENYLSTLPLSSLPAKPPLTFQEEDPLNPPINFQYIYTCTTLNCPLVFTSKLELFQHNMANHIGKYFSSVKPCSLSSDQFNDYINHLLETTFNTFVKVDNKYQCQFCSNLLLEKEKARNHLVAKHRHILKDKIVEHQKSRQKSKTSTTNDQNVITFQDIVDSVIDNNLKKSKNPVLNLYCSHCSLSFPTKWRMFQHDMSNHSEKHFKSVKLKSLNLHQFQNCVIHIINKCVNELQKVESKYQCNLCGKLMSVRQCAKIHLVSKHRPFLKERLIELQNSSNINLIMNTSRKTHKGKWNTSNKEKSQHVCNNCGKEFGKAAFLSKHQSYIHPETFFSSSNLCPSSSENNEQFNTLVRFVLEQQFKSLAPTEGDQVQCGVCGYVSSKQKLQIHLISRHRIFLEEKLKNLQKSGKSLHEIEDELMKMEEPNEVQETVAAQTESNLRTSAITPSKLNIVCTLCSISFKFKHSLFQHNLNYHIEKYFPTANLNGLSNDDFKKSIIDLLKFTVDRFKTINSKYQCSFCPQLLCRRQACRIHLVKKHRVILKDKLLEPQKYGHFSLSRSNTGAQLAFDCSLCSKTFKTKFILFQHDLSYHIGKYFSSVKFGPVSNEQFNNYITDTLSNCADDFKKIHSKYQCTFCPKQLSGRQTIRNHLVVKHRTIIKDKLVEIQKSGNVIQSNGSGISVNTNTTSLKRKRGRPKDKSRLGKNPSLTFNVTSGNLLQKTKSTPDRQRGMRGIKNVPLFHRQRIPKFKRCGGCGKSFTNLYTLRTHLKSYCKVLRKPEEVYTAQV